MKKETKTRKPRKKAEIEDLDIKEAKVDTTKLKSEGLGDLISKFAKKMGFEECDACSQRKLKFNQMFKFLNPNRFLTDSEIEYINKCDSEQYVPKVSDLFNLYNNMFSEKLEPCHCPGLVKTVVHRLKSFADEQLEIRGD